VLRLRLASGLIMFDLIYTRRDLRMGWRRRIKSDCRVLWLL